jgi:hypothetical protein
MLIIPSDESPTTSQISAISQIHSAGLKREDEINFIRAQNCCVCFVDIIDSTRITSNIDNPEKARKYYEIFLNTMGR